MKTEIIESQVVQPTGSVSATFQLPAGVDRAVVIRAVTGSVCPTTPATVRVEQSFDDTPALWLPLDRITSAAQPNYATHRIVRPDPLAKHVRVVVGGHKGAAVTAHAFAVSG